MIDLASVVISCIYLLWFLYGKIVGFEEYYQTYTLNLFICLFLYMVLMFVAKIPKEEVNRIILMPLPFAILCGSMINWLTRGWVPLLHYLVVIFVVFYVGFMFEFELGRFYSGLAYTYWLETLT